MRDDVRQPPVLADEGIVCAIYPITDEQGRVRWLGQANPADDLDVTFVDGEAEVSDRPN